MYEISQPLTCITSPFSLRAENTTTIKFQNICYKTTKHSEFCTTLQTVSYIAPSFSCNHFRKKK